jgi:arsenite-transporting ATPase
VLTPERMAITETERLVARLEDASIPIDSLVVNRVFENDRECPCDRCQRDADRQARRLREIDERFTLPITLVPQLDTESQGLDALSEVGSYLLPEQ